MRVQTGGSDVVTKFYKNFVQQIISSLPRAVSSLTPGTPTSPGSTMIGFDDGTLTETTPEQQESSFSDPSGSSESPSDDASENAEDNGGFWSWLRRRLRRLFGML